MLSRVANSLYWMSRYIERAENVARIADVNLQLFVDFHNLDEKGLEDYWMPIVQSTGDEAAFLQLYPKATSQTVTEFLVFQTENPDSIISSIFQARENARMVRDQITVELWEELNRLYLFIWSPPARDLWRQNPGEFYQQIKASSLHLAGISYATLLHNEGFWFCQAGRFIERADKTSRILDVRHQTLPAHGMPETIGQTEALEWSAILRSCSAWDGYRSLHGVEVDPRLVVEFLLLNADFPRSVRFCAGELNRALRRISGVPEGRFSNEAEKRAGRLVAELQFSDIGDIFEQGLHVYLDVLQQKLNAIGEALFNAYICQAFENLATTFFVQQEQQQQQFGVPPSGGSEGERAPGGISPPPKGGTPNA